MFLNRNIMLPIKIYLDASIMQTEPELFSQNKKILKKYNRSN